MTDIELLIESEAFPSDTKIRHFDHTIQSDFTCPTWVALTKYPFFEVIGFSYIQTVPMIWLILYFKKRRVQRLTWANLHLFRPSGLLGFCRGLRTASLT